MLLLNSVLMVFGLFSAVVLPSGIIATLCLAIAALVISIGEWKGRLGLLPKFKSFPAPAQERRRYRCHHQNLKKIAGRFGVYHLYRGDYSRWFRDAVNDSYLADHTERVEQRKDLQPGETRDLIRSFIEARYTLPQ